MSLKETGDIFIDNVASYSFCGLDNCNLATPTYQDELNRIIEENEKLIKYASALCECLDCIGDDQQFAGESFTLGEIRDYLKSKQSK